ncbi:DUF2147 domain-containing protein [Caulobacter sp. 602-2]|uniref:DUF2147 domain-containing protein n=1 Tax=Caulobacter sp. 602-2 TaxID=2710887 RepID=A0A6G4R3I9_9CAUL|nr:DUF2147 domain-containing protein [Caulobacter sp. 602-2]NGM52450.1 DUF2147 domain-containing protein [Caulobacter sp. 602-2]
MLRTAILAAVASAAFVAPAMAADITGLWQTETNGGQVEISRCGNSLCGKLLTSDNIKKNPTLKDEKNKDPSLRTRPLKGLQLLWGFSGGPDKWTGGKVYKADDGATYSGTITMTDANTLKLKGCVVAPLCKTQTWTRVK